MTGGFEVSSGDPFLNSLLLMEMGSDSDIFTRFVLDPSSDSDCITAIQIIVIDINTIFKLTRTFCYSIHKARMQILSEAST